jgi:hypothetical protein
LMLDSYERLTFRSLNRGIRYNINNDCIELCKW